MFKVTKGASQVILALVDDAATIKPAVDTVVNDFAAAATGRWGWPARRRRALAPPRRAAAVRPAREAAKATTATDVPHFSLRIWPPTW